MTNSPWVHHIIVGVVKTLPLCGVCNRSLHPHSRSLLGSVYVKEDRFMIQTPDSFIECI